MESEPKTLKLTDEVSKGVNELLKKQNLRLGRKKGGKQKAKYTKKKGYKKSRLPKERLLIITEGYDLLENLLVVRPYIQKRYSLGLRLFELLLYLKSKKIFTYYDYYYMPKSFTYLRIQKLIEMGHVVQLNEARSKVDMLFKLSVKSSNIVEEFYQLLSGEKKFPLSWKDNPMVRKAAPESDRLKVNLMKSLNAMPQESKKGFYE